MNILLTGASGFIGRRLAIALRGAGHRVIEGRRRPPDAADAVDVDFTKDLNEGAWVERLRGLDAVINAVGILRERGEQTFERVHARAPQALFSACAIAGVRRVVQISALGADDGDTDYFRSKHAADEHLRSLPLEWTIVQPSLVYGPGGTSARLFTLLASLPIVGVPGRGEQRVQPIHIDDLTEAIVNLFGRDEFSRRRVALVGPKPLEYRDFLLTLRGAMGVPGSFVLPVPKSLMRAGAALMEMNARSLLDRDTLTMLDMGVTADAADARRLLGRAPRPPSEFITPADRNGVRLQAQFGWLAPMLRIAIALVWLWTGVVSLGWYPVEQSYALLARTGAPAAAAPLLLYGAAALDFLFGIATLLLQRRSVLWLAQMALILLYTVIITIKLPEYWLHPYGPILKNLPMLAAIFLLYTLEKRDS